MMWQRITFGALMIAAMLGLIWLDDRIAQHLADDWTPKLLINLGLYAHEGLLFTTFVAVVAVFAVREMGRLLTAAGYRPSTFGAALASVVLVFIPFQVRNGLTDNVSADPATEAVYTVNWLLLAIGATFLLVVARKRTDGAIGAVASTLFIILYIGLLAAFVVRLRMWSSAWLVAYFLLVVKVCDIGAYFTGMAIGRHKLIAWLSPKKTWEGAIGGTAVTVAVAWGVAWLVREHGPPRIAPLFPEPREAIWFGLAMAVVGQCGDLVESLLKRDAQTKDSGAVVPAFGGVLDIIDSPLLTAPVAYWMLVRL